MGAVAVVGGGCLEGVGGAEARLGGMVGGGGWDGGVGAGWGEREERWWRKRCGVFGMPRLSRVR